MTCDDSKSKFYGSIYWRFLESSQSVFWAFSIMIIMKKIGYLIGIIIGCLIAAFTFGNINDSISSCYYMVAGLYVPDIGGYLISKGNKLLK